MTITYNANGTGVLIIRANEQERANLKDISNTDRPGREIEYEALEDLCANSELEWIDPSETGDLTDAPMLGIRDGDVDQPTCESPVIARWAFMDYQLRSFVDDLIEKGEAIFIS